MRLDDRHAEPHTASALLTCVRTGASSRLGATLAERDVVLVPSPIEEARPRAADCTTLPPWFGTRAVESAADAAAMGSGRRSEDDRLALSFSAAVKISASTVNCGRAVRVGEGFAALPN